MDNHNSDDGFINIDEMYKSGNIKIPPPRMLNQKKLPSNLEVLYEKTNKDVGVLNKQYNKLLIETNTLRKRIAYYESKVREIENDNKRLRNTNSQLRSTIDQLNDDITIIKNKLGIKK